ncbi:MAG: hypothetical protein JSS95_13010 [Acidobacteria bacterium]|nr:hypothetical protein [Acidobacteriota bacterium]
MDWKLKLALMNLATAAALFYRWRHGAPMLSLAITGIIAFAIVNILVPLTSKRTS